MSPADIASSNGTLTATPAAQTVTVSGNATSDATVSYALVPPTTGTLAVTISGLTAPTLASATVTGPGGYTHALTATTTLSGLTVGTYTVTATLDAENLIPESNEDDNIATYQVDVTN